MTTDDTNIPDEFDLSEAPAEGDGYYQAKTRQWVDLCPHLGPSDRTVLRILTDLTTHASHRRKVSLDELRGVVTTNPVALGEEPKPISASGLLRILRNLAALGQITADEAGTPLKFSSRKSAQARPISMTIWRLPRHECGCHRNAFDALAAAKGQEPRFEPARMDESAVRRRPKRAGQKSNPRGSTGQKSNPGGQKSNPRGQKLDPDSHGDQREPALPITPPTSLSSSSSEVPDTTPSSVGTGEEEDETPSANTTPTSATAQDLMGRIDASAEEAEAVLDAIEADAERRKVDVGSLRRYVSGFDVRDLNRFLRQIRAQRAPQPRTAASEATGPDPVCTEHHEPLDCPVCATLHPRMVQLLLNRFGPIRRPDLAARLTPTGTSA
ncbi:hypothetical protein [Nocardiopsis sp. FIRDI 009]|uniref:hypothetical protein n=1 Tax=Nocardiopsis sp. FIRDI 009 TaxID=714197 RepID=UPI000E26303E|nr:hypothetical protein [Nocardiopsis sp. FIRDI 009]